MRGQAKSYLPFLVLGLLAWLSFAIGNTFGTALTIFAVLVWACIGLMVVYMLLFRGVKFTLFADDPVPETIFVNEEGSLESQREPAVVQHTTSDGDVLRPADHDHPVARDVPEAPNAPVSSDHGISVPSDPPRPGTAVVKSNQ
jgi:hypothetical protein